MLPYWNYMNDTFVHTIWPESEDIDPQTFAVLMATANALCVAYAPVLPDETNIPGNYKMAEIFQARHTWAQANGGIRQEVGPDGLAIPTYPLVFAAQDLLRPKSSPLSRVR